MENGATGAPIIDLDDRTFQDLIDQPDRPFVVMFYSPSCSHCKSFLPYFLEYAKEYEGSVAFGRVNVVTNQWTAERFGVLGTPTFKFFCHGRPVQELVGAVFPAILRRMVEEVILHGRECVDNSTAIDYEVTGYG
jgi:thioredoxin-like negative regulator of GroEL